MRSGWGPVIACGLAACTSFGDSTPKAAPEADGGQATDSGQAITTSFCGAHATALFCDDFEQPDRSFTTPKPWDAIDGDATNLMSLVPDQQTGHALHLGGRLTDNVGRFLAKGLPRDTERFRWTFRYRINRKLEPLDTLDQGQFRFATMQFEGARRIDFTFFDGGEHALASSNLNDGTDQLFWFEGPPIPTIKLDGTWQSYRIEIEPVGDKARLRFFIDDQPQLTVDGLDRATYPTLSLGGTGLIRGVTVDVDIDNVLAETF